MWKGVQRCAFCFPRPEGGREGRRKGKQSDLFFVERIIIDTALHELACQRIRSIIDLLESLSYLADETPIVEDPNQRFGNKAFRTYIQRTTDYLSPSGSSSSTADPNLSQTFLQTCPEEIKADVLGLWIGGNAWGHETRLDYGTGHELAFVLVLWVLVKRGWLAGERDGAVEGSGSESVDEDDLILRVFPRWVG